MIGISKIPALKSRYTAARIHTDRMWIRDKLTKNQMLYVGKDYADVERVINILNWMGIPFHDYWKDECNAHLGKLGIKP